VCWTEDDASEKKGELLTCAIEGALQRVLGARVVVHAGVPTPEEFGEGLIFARILDLCFGPGPGCNVGAKRAAV
jgi:hypothetical protein